MASMFQKATRKKLRARIALDGPAGSGKSYTALRFGFALAGPGGKVAVIDTEHRSASKYSGESPDGIPFQFDVCELEHYAPSTYTGVIREAGKAGYDVLIIDSLSHGWEGVGGALDQVDRKAASSKSGNSFTAWRDVTPQHREMVEAILACPCHVIATMRSKMAYELETDKNGKLKPVKVGLKPIQREGVEYEFDLVGDLDVDHLLTISKSRCSFLDGAKAVKPGVPFIQPLIIWLAEGIDAPLPDFQSAEVPAVPPAGTTQAPTECTKKTSKGVRLSGEIPPVSGHEASVNAPCGDDMAVRIKTAAQKIQLPPEKLREFASRCGVTRLAEMPWKEAAALLSKLEAKVSESEIPF